MKETERLSGNRDEKVPVSEKYMLTINEASQYFSIGVKNMRRMAEENKGSFVIFMGNRYLIIRTKFEEYIDFLADGEEEQEL